MQWNKMSKGQQAAARRLRDAVNAAGVMDPAQGGPVEVSVSQVAKHLDAAMAWERGEITLTALCDTAGWTAPEAQVPAEEPQPDGQPETASYTLTVIRGECGPGANGEELGQSDLEGVDLGAEVGQWLAANGVGQGDPDVWVLVTPGDEHPGRLANLVAQREVTVDGWEVAIHASLPAADGLDR